MASQPEERLQTQLETPQGECVDDSATLREELLTSNEELRTQYEELAAVRLELESAAARSEQLFGGSTVGYLITDPRGIILDANRAAWQLFGHSAPPQGRRSIATQFPPGSRRTIRALIGRASVVDQPQADRVTLYRGGEDLELRVTVELRTEAQSGAALLRWELVPADASPLLRLLTEPDTDTETSASELGRLLSLARADLAAGLSSAEDPELLLTRAVQLSWRWIPHVKHASVMIQRKGGKPRTAAATSDTATDCDHAQVELGEGPVSEVIADQRPRRADDLVADPRWPRFATYAVEHGVRSLLVCELPVLRGGDGTLNLYSDEPRAFTPLAELLAPVFAARASIALAHADKVFNLRRAIATRQQIGQAVGILMERYKIDEHTAFERLVTASQQAHVKLREIAARITETGEEPEDITT
jgi:ANTAR domain-containing protein/GAF domain-containing protein/PAS domain-containing protein